MKRYVVTKDAERMMPKWLASRINYRSVKLSYRIRDGTEVFTGIKIGDAIAGIGDMILFDGKRMSVERSDAI